MDVIIEKNYLGSIEIISSAASKSGLDFTRMSSVGVEIADLSDFLEISSVQVIFLSCLAELSFQKTVTMDLLSKHLKCGVFRLITYMSDFEELEKKGYIRKIFRTRGRKQSYNDIAYIVPHYVIEAIRKADINLMNESVKYDLPGLLKQISTMVEERQQNSVPTSQLLLEAQFLISANRELPFVEFVDSGLKSLVSKCTILALSYNRLKGLYATCIDGFANALFDDLSEQLDFEQMVCSGMHELVTCNFLSLVNSEFDGEKMVAVSESALKLLYQNYPALLVLETKNEGIIRHSDIKEKNLYFNMDVVEKIITIKNALEPGMFRNYRDELQKNKLSRGITSIFFGAPGTGKTEAVYQLARKTGRDIMMVDLSQTKSKWFGESEKQVKKIFDDYACLLRNSETEPILFVNEADGLFTKRIDLNNSRGNASEQAVNTMQNILLQALENFEGILVATTNLTGNLDRAFERRFTFRVDFSKPGSAIRKKIWMSKLSGLSDDEASVLGERFDMTGGEIDVQVRQVILKKVLHGNDSVFEAAMECCTKDNTFAGRKKVGF